MGSSPLTFVERGLNTWLCALVRFDVLGRAQRPRDVVAASDRGGRRLVGCRSPSRATRSFLLCKGFVFARRPPTPTQILSTQYPEHPWKYPEIASPAKIRPNIQ
eukprot:scaffold71965_cov30-Tisochrysis_lutea.AAC.4